MAPRPEQTWSRKDAAALLRANPAAARRSETRLAADPLSFREEIEENAAQSLPSTTIKNLYPVAGIQVRREDEQAAPTGLRTPVWSTRHIIPVGLPVVLDIALVQDQTAPLGATKLIKAMTTRSNNIRYIGGELD